MYNNANNSDQLEPRLEPIRVKNTKINFNEPTKSLLYYYNTRNSILQ